MFVIEVIPLKRGVQIESLSYFSAESYDIGTILSVPVRNQEIRGMVIDVKAVSGAKTALRAATFTLKKLPFQSESKSVSPALIKTAYKIADLYACQVGGVLYQLLPPEVRDGKIPLPHTHHIDKQTSYTPEILQGSLEERYLMYRSLIRETFAHAGSVVLVVPSSIDALVARQRLQNGIEERIVVLTSTSSAKEIREGYQSLEDFSKQKLIITTISHSILERHDITAVIVEGSRSNLFRERTRPYLDYREVLRVHSDVTGRRLIYGDLLPRTEEEAKRRDEIYATYGETPKRIALPGTLSLIKMNDNPEPTSAFKLFSDEVVTALRKTKKDRGRSFLFAARRGLAPVVACIDCGHIFRSPDSGAPYSLIRMKKGDVEERWFVCGVSGHRERAADVCPDCGSWRLRERGIGIQYVHDELVKLFPDTPIVLFDHTSASTFKKALFLRDKFYSTKGGIMLGTHMALPYLTSTIETSVVVNTDALRATPTWRQQEDTLAHIFTLREVTSGNVFVQTRTEQDDLIEYAKTGAAERFYDEEVALRKSFGYPPYTRFIHLTWQGTKETNTLLEERIKKILDGYEVSYYSAPPSPKGPSVRYGLLRANAASWPLPDLVAKLRLLPPSIRIVMNPERIV